MKLTIEPTTAMHVVEPNTPGGAVFGRLWIGTDEDGFNVQAVILGVALDPAATAKLQLIPCVPIETPEGFTFAFPEKLKMPDQVPGLDPLISELD